jgi:hypothetical protein
LCSRCYDAKQSSAKDRPRPVPIAVPAPSHACGRTPASRSCGHRCRRFLVVGAAHRPIHVLVFLLSQGSAPRLDANMGANCKRDINSGLSLVRPRPLTRLCAEWRTWFGKSAKTLTFGLLFQVILSSAEAADQEMGGISPAHGRNRAASAPAYARRGAMQWSGICHTAWALRITRSAPCRIA